MEFVLNQSFVQIGNQEESIQYETNKSGTSSKYKSVSKFQSTNQINEIKSQSVISSFNFNLISKRNFTRDSRYEDYEILLKSRAASTFDLQLVEYDFFSQPSTYPYDLPIRSSSNNFGQLDNYQIQFKQQKNIKNSIYPIQSEISFISKPNNLKLQNDISEKIPFNEIYKNKTRLNEQYFEKPRFIQRKIQAGFQILKDFYSLGITFTRSIQNLYSIYINNDLTQQNTTEKPSFTIENPKQIILNKYDAEMQALAITNVMDI